MSEAPETDIVLVGPAYPYRGGIAHFLESMYEGLQRRGPRMTVVTFSRQYPDILFPGATQFAKDPDGREVTALRLIDSINPISWYRAANHIAKTAPRAVVFQFWLPFFGPAFGVIARRLKKRGIRIIAVVHNALPHEKRPGDALMSRYFLQHCDAFLVLSASVEQDLEKLGVSGDLLRIEHPVYDVFGDPVDRQTARQQLKLPSETPVLLFFGFVRPYKGLHVLLQAMPAVVRALPDVRLVVAGECYEDEAIYRKLVEEHDLHEHVQLRFEYIPDDEIPALFSAADIVVQPYVSATQSGVAQIAYQFERPLIVTDVGGLAEVVPHEEAGLVVSPGDPDALSAMIIRFFDENMAERLAEGVSRAKKRYSWDRLFDVLEEYLDLPRNV